MTFDSLRAAQDYLSRAWCPVPVLRGEKRPDVKGWQNLRLTEAELPHYFSNGQNVGLLLGEPSGYLVDVDLDTPESLQLAAAILPTTDRRHGRAGRPESHRWYLSEVPKTTRYKDLDGTSIVELRTTGAQTIVPPSIHPSGEPLQWHAEGTPARVEPRLLATAVASLASCALLARHWPKTAGSRHDVALALGGLLIRGGVSSENACTMVGLAARAAGDEESADRVRAIRDTAAKLGAGHAATGIPTLARLLPQGDDVAGLLQRWLQLVEGNPSPMAQAASERQLESRSVIVPNRPTIRIRHDIPAVVDEAVAALAATSKIELYQRARILVRVERDRGGVRKGIRRAPGAPVIAPIPIPSLRELMACSADWVRMTDRGPRPALPPPWAASTLADRIEWPLPHLEGVIEAPCLRPDGSFLEKTGYDPETGLLYDPGDTVFPTIPTAPTAEDARHALDELLDCLHDFPFLGSAGTENRPSYDRSAALALILTLLARHAIDGPTPLFAIRAPTAGTGKTLLADWAAVLATGRPAARMVQGQNQEEDRKRILALGLEGAPLVLLDNVEGLLGSPALAAALTATTFKERLLGKNRNVTVRLDGVWIATGNNLGFQGDLGRRVVPIDLDARVELPEERQGFRHQDLLAWTKIERGRLVMAALNVLRAWVVAGRPQPKLAAFGSFEAWSMLVRAALVWIGEPDPCQGRQRIREAGDPDLDALRTALRAWYKAFHEQGKTLREAVATAETDPDLKVALAALDKRSDGRTLDVRRLGYAFRRFKGRIVNGFRLEQERELGEAGAIWRVVTLTPPHPGDPDDHEDAPNTLEFQIGV